MTLLNSGIDAVQAHVREAFERASQQRLPMARTTAAQRIVLMRRLVDVMLKHKPAIYAAVKAERGIGPADVDGELLMVKAEVDHLAANVDKWMRKAEVEPSLMTMGKRCYIHYEPKGIVLNLATWNAPFAISFIPVVGALSAGNSVVLKPSELAPHSSAAIATIVREAFPNGEVSVVEGGAETAQALLAQPFNHVFYIGNNVVGRLVMKAAADHCASVTLEMGGKNPTIIGASADIPDTALKTAWGRMCNGGQACITPDYALVHESVESEFTRLLVQELSAMYNPDGRGFANNPDYPIIINERHFNRIRSLIEDARAKGAEVVCGGEYDEARRIITPTVLRKVSDDMRVMQEEIFGPVLCIVPFREREDAVKAIASREKPLSLYIFSRDRSEVDYFLDNTTAGSTVVNHNVIQSGTNSHLAFGGVNTSGIGRMLGFASFTECSNARSVIEEGPSLMPTRDMMPPLSDKMAKQLSTLLTQKAAPDWIVRTIDGVLKLRAKFWKGAIDEAR